jgi:hypothetical protein
MMTVAMLIERLNEVPEDERDTTWVVMDDNNAWWNHVLEVHLPEHLPPHEVGFAAVSLATGQELDTRDF